MAQPLRISMACPYCGFRFKVDRKYAGRKAQCPSPECGQRFRIPESPATESSAAEQPQQSLKSARARQSGEPTRQTDEFAAFDLDARGPAPLRNKREARNRRPLPVSVLSTGQSFHRAGETLRKLNWQAWVGIAGVLICVLGIAVAPNGSSGNADLNVGALQAATEQPKPDLFKTQVRPFVEKYCFECHSQAEAEAGIDFAKYEDGNAIIKGEPRKAWEKVLGMLEIGAMPPPDSAQPTPEEKQAVVGWLNDKLYHLDCDLVNDPGRVTIRRLNRAEYNNTIRDLLGVAFRPADDFPSDDVGYGFDNIGDVLALSPLLMEKYLDAAERITEEAIPVHDPGKAQSRFAGKDLRSKESFDLGGDGFWNVNSNGGVYLDYDASVDGDYRIAIRAKAEQFGNEPARMELRVDGKQVQLFDIRGQRRLDDYQHQLALKSGRHRIEAVFVNDFYERRRGDRNLMVGHFEITAPPPPTTVDGFITVRPENGLAVADAARQVLRPFISKAFRRPATDSEVNQFLKIVEMALGEGESYDKAIQLAVQGVLVSPSFLFRIETDPRPDDPRSERSVTDYELASRLSYFLWSSMPDAELMNLAASGELRNPQVLERQTRRMLADSKSQALVENFATQWLNLRSLDEVTPDPELFQEFGDELRDDMRRETLLLFETVMKDDRSVLDFIDADFTFVNQRLAKLYGIAGVTGDQFERVTLNPAQRAGVLTQASILTITSNPDRTSPVKRGKWIMENILGTPPPPPPPDVPDLEETKKARPDASLREQLQVHRESPMCASCHTTMDTLGFGFENFNAIGVWRDRDGRHTIDPSGTLPSGEAFKGPVELVRILRTRSQQFSRCLAEKMLTYALGRGLEYYDRCAVDEILNRLAARQHRFSELVLGIVNSKPFLQRRGDGDRL